MGPNGQQEQQGAARPADAGNGLSLLVAAATQVKTGLIWVYAQQPLPALIKGCDLSLKLRKQTYIAVIPFELLQSILSQPIGGMDDVVDAGHMAGRIGGCQNLRFCALRLDISTSVRPHAVDYLLNPFGS